MKKKDIIAALKDVPDDWDIRVHSSRKENCVCAHYQQPCYCGYEDLVEEFYISKITEYKNKKQKVIGIAFQI